MYIIQFRLYMTLPFVTYIVTYEISTRFLWILDKSGEFKQPGSVAWRTVQTAACPSSMPHEAFQGTRTLLLWQDYLHRRVIAVLQWSFEYLWQWSFEYVAFDACAFMSMQVGPQKVFIPVAGQAQQLVCTAFTCFDVVALVLPPM